MKTKKLSKKLVTNKKTIANLNASNMNNVKGGVHDSHTCEYGTCGCGYTVACGSTVSSF